MLNDKINEKYACAIGKGAIFKMKTNMEKLTDENTGIEFLMNVAESLNKKPKAKNEKKSN